MQRVVDLRLVDVGDGGQLGVIVGVKRLRGGAAAAAAAADQSDLDGIGHGLRGDDGGKSGDQRARGPLEEIATIGGEFVCFHAFLSSLLRYNRLDEPPSICSIRGWPCRRAACDRPPAYLHVG